MKNDANETHEEASYTFPGKGGAAGKEVSN